MQETTVFEQAVLDLCKKAGVKSPSDLVGKRICFVAHEGKREIKVFETILRISIANAPEIKNSYASLFLSVGESFPGSLFTLNYSLEEKEWRYSDKINTNNYFQVEHMIFPRKWWEF
jgi:hypothetical protein